MVAMASEQSAMRRSLRGLARRHASMIERAQVVEQERTAAYMAARALTPPLTFKEIADIFGVTEAAVMQKVKRHLDAEAKKKKPRRSRVGAGVEVKTSPLAPADFDSPTQHLQEVRQ